MTTAHELLRDLYLGDPDRTEMFKALRRAEEEAMADEKAKEYMTKQQGEALYAELDGLKARLAALEGAKVEEDVRHRGVKGFWLPPEQLGDLESEPLKPGQGKR